MPKTIVSVAGRAETGGSRPFFCESDDGGFHYVKRDNVSRDQLVIEYVISRLAEECGLPVAPVAILEIPSELARYAVVERAEEFCPGMAFASQRISFADDLRATHLRQIPEDLKIRCLCFDWWVRNSDRRLDMLGGDPNVLWDPNLQSIALIDHDQCLDPEFDPDEFRREHVFRDSRPFVERPFFEKWRTKFESTIYNLGDIWDEVPPEWLEDDTGTARVSFTRQEIESRLIKPELPADGILAGR
ncbi:MAG: HipA family kinase [Verrucomicrobiales bacterium]